jgi:transketolase
MRKKFSTLLFDSMAIDHNINLITADLGFGILDKIQSSYPDRFFNTGAAEQLMIGIGIGMAENKKIPICYSITPFLLYRPFELLRNYINYEKIPVKLVGAGRDKDYNHDGISHWAEDDEDILKCLPNIQIYKPMTENNLIDILPEFLYNNKPSYLNLVR